MCVQKARLMHVSCWFTNDQTGLPAISCSHPHEQKESYSMKTRSGTGTRYLIPCCTYGNHAFRGMVSIFWAYSLTHACMHANTHTYTHANPPHSFQRASTLPKNNKDGRIESFPLLQLSLNSYPLHTPLSCISSCSLEWGCICREEKADERSLG